MSLIAAERIKLVSTRSPWWCAGLAIVASIGLSSLIAVATAKDGQVATVASTQFGYVLGMAVVMVMATLAVTTEYSVGTIRTTFMAVPRRSSALVAKWVATVPQARSRLSAWLPGSRGTYRRRSPLPAVRRRRT